MTELIFTPARELAAAIRERRLSSVEVVTAFLDRIDEVDGEINAVTTRVPRAEALAAAEKADEAVASGAPLGAIHGLPIAVKDLMDVAGLRTTHGSLAYKDAPPATRDSLLAERLRAGGAIFVGKTNTPEHGLGTLTYNDLFGPCHSPWDTTKNAGGSSGGAGAAVAAGMLPFADGSDSGGSIRYPAAINNLVGLRCSPGRIPSGRPGDGWTPHGVLGPIARDAADAGLLLSALAGADPRAPLSIDEDGAKFADVASVDVAGLRIAWSPTAGGLPIDPEVSRVLGETIALLAGAGAEVTEIEPAFFEHADECWEIVEMLGFVEAAGQLVDEHRDEVREDLARNVDQGRAMSADEIARGLALRTEVFRGTAALLAEYDVLALPTTPLVSVDAELPYPPEIDGVKLNRYFEWQRTACRVVVTAHPALSVPGGFSADGLPVGLQLVGPHRGDLALLNVAAGIEAVTGFAERRPELLTRRDTDVLVLGMGAAGARAAQVLAGAGLRVVGVEAGGWLPGEPGWFARTVPSVRRPGRLPSGDADAPTPRLGGRPSPHPDDSPPPRPGRSPGPRTPGATVAEAATEPAPMVNAVGGSNHRSARQSYRLDLDATPARWPLTTDELLPYCARVEEAAAVEPSPAAPWTERMRAAAASLGWETITAPIATAPPLGPRELCPLVDDGRLEVLTETVATRLLAAADGSVVGAEVMGRGGRERIEAKRVVLAAHTFENVRLLLLSRPPSHPEGIGNGRGQVGAGFATHNLLLAHGHFPGTDLARHLGAPGHAVAVIDFDLEDPAGSPSGDAPEFRGGSILQAAMGAADPERVTAATGLRGEALHEVGSVWAQPEQLAREENRLDLDPTRLDPLGRPLLVATHDLDAEDLARADFLLGRMAEWLSAAGADMTWRAKPRPTSIATHSYGGTTMGLDPEASVVDRFCQVHDAPGLFVLGASTFPATGGRGPTETVEALAWRTADRIVGELAP